LIYCQQPIPVHTSVTIVVLVRQHSDGASRSVTNTAPRPAAEAAWPSDPAAASARTGRMPRPVARSSTVPPAPIRAKRHEVVPQSAAISAGASALMRVEALMSVDVRAAVDVERDTGEVAAIAPEQEGDAPGEIGRA